MKTTINFVIKIFFLALIFLDDKNLVSSASVNQSAFNEVLTVQPTAFIQLQFPYNINSDYASIAITGSATGYQSNSMVVLSATGASGVTGAAQLKSRAYLHYQPGQGCTTLFSAIFTTGATGSTQLIGIGNLNISPTSGYSPSLTDLQDGFFFGYSGSTFGIFQYNNNSATFTAQTSWNGDMLGGTGSSAVTLDQSKGNVYKIQFQWLGFGVIKFYVQNPSDGSWILAHTIRYPNANTDTSLKNPSLQLLAFLVSNATTGATGTPAQLKTSGMAGMIEGYLNSDIGTRNSISWTAPAILVTPTGYTGILTIKNNTGYNNAINQTLVYPDHLSLQNIDTTSSLVFTLFLNVTGSVSTPTFLNINQNTSVVSRAQTGIGGIVFNVVGSPSVTPGKELMTFYSEDANSLNVSLYDYGVVLVPGDTLTLAVRSIGGTTAAGDVRVSLSWIERF